MGNGGRNRSGEGRICEPGVMEDRRKRWRQLPATAAHSPALFLLAYLRVFAGLFRPNDVHVLDRSNTHTSSSLSVISVYLFEYRLVSRIIGFEFEGPLYRRLGFGNAA